MPLISIVTISYQSIEYIEGCINSVLSQDFNDYEYVIIDGGSIDGTKDIILKYSNNLSYWHSKKDKGIADAFNQGIQNSTGKWILFINSDDLLAKNTVLSDVAVYLKKMADADVVYGKIQRIARSKDILPISMPVGAPFTWRSFVLRDTIPHPTAFTNRAYFERVGLFNNSYKIAMDYEHYLRAGPKLDARFIPLLISYMREGGVSRQDFRKVLDEWELSHINTGHVPVWVITLLKLYLSIRHFVASLIRNAKRLAIPGNL